MWRIIEAYDQLNAWIRASEGQFIELDNGEAYRFVRQRTFSGRELEAFEEGHGAKLPPEYRRFLIGVGGVELFAGPLRAGIRVLGPDEAKAFAEKAFEKSGGNPFPALLPAVTLPDFGGCGCFRPEAEREQRYGVFYPAAPPEQGLQEGEFGTFDEWVADLVESRGKQVGMKRSADAE